jgi:transposase
VRDVVDGIRYLTHNGPVWRALPADYPPAWTVCSWATKWQADGSTETMHGQLRDRVRQVADRKPAPTAAIVDSRSVRASEEAAQAGRGYDAGNHAGWVVMPGWLLRGGAAAGQWGERGRPPGITTGFRGR